METLAIMIASRHQAGRTILSEYAGLLSNASWASGQSVQLYLSLSLADQVQILTIPDCHNVGTFVPM